MEPSVINILKSYRVNDSTHTHVTVFTPKDKYRLSRDVIDSFWLHYCKALNLNDSVILGIAEKPQDYIPVMADIDIKVENLEDEIHTLYTDEQLEHVIKIYQDILREIVDGCTNRELVCFVLEKPPYEQIKNNTSYIKNGFHLHFPYIFLNKIDHEVHLHPRVLKEVKEAKVFSDLGIEDSSSLVDKTYNKHWLIYGSRKDKSADYYKLTKIYNSELTQITLEKALENYKIYNSEEKPLKLKGKEKYYLPRILSIIPYGRKITEINPLIESPINIICSREKKPERYAALTVKENIDMAQALLPMLSDYRAKDRNEWITVGWVLYNISKGSQEGLELWIEFSKRCPESFSEKGCVYEWNRMTKTTMTIGTLKYFASIDSPEEYEKFRNIQTRKHINEAIDKSHNSLAKALFEEYGTYFVCSNITEKKWYTFSNHTWKIDNEGNSLRVKISSELSNHYAEIGKKIYEEMAKTNDEATKSLLNAKNALIQRMIKNLGNSTFKNSVMRECMEVFYDDTFEKKLNSNKYLIAFKNGVYDLKQFVFRNGKPEDYISLQLGVEYEEFNEYDDEVSEVHDYLDKIFPDKSLKKYFLDTTSNMFIGGNAKKEVFMWTGENGHNGKSVTVTIMEKIFGDYIVKIDPSVFVGKKGASGSAQPDLARANEGARLAFVEETDKKHKIDISILKRVSGNDSGWYRDLFEKGKGAKEKIPMYKTVFVYNKPPQVPFDDKATWNRIKVLPYESTFVEEDELPETVEQQLKEKKFLMDPDFSDKIPHMIKPFTWVLLEHLKNTKGDYKEPEKVKMATSHYRKRNDIYRQFVDECIIEDDTYTLTIKELYSSFKDWIKDMPNHKLPDKTDVVEYFTTYWGNPGKGIKWKGYRIRLIDDDKSEETKSKNEDDAYLTD